MCDHPTQSVQPVTDQEVRRRLARCYAFLLQLARERSGKKPATEDVGNLAVQDKQCQEESNP